MKLMRSVSTGVLIFLLFVSIYTFTMSGQIRFGDEGERYFTAQSIVERGDLAIPIQPDLHRKIGVDGRNYSSYELGSILPLVPFYALGAVVSKLFALPDAEGVTMLFSGLYNPVLTALAVVVLYRFGMGLGFSSKTSFGASAIFGLSTIALPYSKAFERESVLALCLLLATYAAVRFRQTGKTQWLVLTSFSAAFLVFAKLASVIMLPFFALYFALIWIATHKSILCRETLFAAFAFVAPIVLLVGIQAFSNRMRFGSFTDTGLASIWGNPLSYFGLEYLPQGLLGTLFSLEKSIFLYSPPIILFLPAWVLFFKRQRSEAILILCLILVNLVFNAMNVNWAQASWWGLKYLVLLTPLLILPIGFLLEAMEQSRAARAGWFIVAAFAVAGFAVQVVGVLVDDREYLDIVGHGIDLADGIGFLRYGAIDPLLIQFSPVSRWIQINPFGVLLLATVAIFFGWIVWRLSEGGSKVTVNLRASWGVLVAVLLIQFIGMTLWVILPFSQVNVARADSKVVAGDLFLSDGKLCEAKAMYLRALDRETSFQVAVVERLAQLAPRASGTGFSADDLMRSLETSDETEIRRDDANSIVGDGALMIRAPLGQETSATALSDFVDVQSNGTYEISGWIKSKSVAVSGYGVITVYEDDGTWASHRSMDIWAVNGTHGWQLFAKRFMTLSTSKRLLVKVGLWKSAGTVWVDGITLTLNPPNVSGQGKSTSGCE